jgi:GntR family transcriptional regulator/MocR family aminotransferase
MMFFAENPFRPAPDAPLYQQLYAHLQAAILAGRLPRGAKLPSTRALADELRVSRNTVLAAYEQLTAEGYLESAKGSGTFVACDLPDALLTASTARVPPASQPRRAVPAQPALSARARAQLTSRQIWPALPAINAGRPRPFSLGLSALDVFPYKLWSHLLVRQARRLSSGAIAYQPPAGYAPLREAIAAHVTVSRQAHCAADQVVIVAGAQGAFDLVARVLLDAGDPVWMEDPGYVGARGAFLGAGAQIIPVPVDQEGLIVEAAIARAPHARLAYVTPSHQFPLGVTMSLTRRLALLDWAQRANAYILEDDYDSEYRFAERPLAALQGLDRAGRVIYIGTFSKVLAPALRIGYLILPPPLVEPFLEVRRLIDFHAPTLEQAVLADFMAEGHYTRHLRRMRTLYASRRGALLEALRELPLEVHASPVGSHCIGWLPEDIDEAALVREAIARGLNLWLVSQYSIEPLPRQGLVLGYGAHSPEETREAVGRLGAAMQAVKRDLMAKNIREGQEA